MIILVFEASAFNLRVPTSELRRWRFLHSLFMLLFSFLLLSSSRYRARPKERALKIYMDGAQSSCSGSSLSNWCSDLIRVLASRSGADQISLIFASSPLAFITTPCAEISDTLWISYNKIIDIWQIFFAKFETCIESIIFVLKVATIGIDTSFWFMQVRYCFIALSITTLP